MRYTVISADNHIVEPRDLFVTRMPKEFRDRAPRVLRASDGGDGWSMAGETPARSFGLEATAGRSVQVEGYKWEDILPGNYDPDAHLADMKADGIDAAVLFPTVSMASYNMPADAYSLAMTRTYNDYLIGDFQATDPKRLIGLPLVPVNHGMETAVAELKRCTAKGAKGFFIPAFPNTSYLDPAYETLWAAAAEAGTPLCMHRNNGGKDPQTGDFNAQYKIPGLNVAGSVSRYFSAVIPLTQFIFTGIFERHPDLKIVAAEVNFGWVPYWIFQMDQCHGQQKTWARFPFKGQPGEFVGKNVFVTVLDDEVGFGAVNANPVMAEMGMFSIDYPHSVCLWPGALNHIDRVTEGVDASLKAKILHGTAERVFGLN